MLARCLSGLVVFGFLPAAHCVVGAEQAAKVSYDRDVRPILQVNCQGCHQPAKAGGDLVMSFESLISGGESGMAAVVAGKPDESYLIEQITPEDGSALMPAGKPPLAASDIAVIRTWIEQGAEDDTPQNARQRYDADHPPVYTAPPVIPSLDYSPDGSLLTVAGFHEVLLIAADGSEVKARLVGVSQRIESVRFSPDGSLLAVAGGLPGRMGELQLWQVSTESLQSSLPITHDTIYGASWSPDGRLVALGCADNSLRAIEAASGDEVVYMAAHDDWVRSTAFSADGASIFSASRDMTVKMTDVATERFVGNVTTHTPGVLRGGQLTIQRHPTRNEVLVGGADGAPKLFQMDVKAAPANGGNPNQIREYEALPGRVFDVRFDPQGARFFACSSLDGVGQIRAYETDSGKTLWQLDVPAGLYALACSPDGTTLAAAGADGQIRRVDASNGTLLGSFAPFPVQPPKDDERRWVAAPIEEPEPLASAARPPLEELSGLACEPAAVRIVNPTDSIQLVLSGQLAGNEPLDVTRRAVYRVQGKIGRVTPEGRFVPAADGSGSIIAEAGGRSLTIPVEVSGMASDYAPDFRRDVNPILSRLGCNQGTCHGSAQGKNGFKLSLRGYDALYDVRSLTDDLASRRVTVCSPDDSLMLLKATAAVPHEGGQLIKPDSEYYQILRRWIAHSAGLDQATPRVSRIEVLPQNPIVAMPGGTQQMRVIASYADGSTRDVTREAFLESGNAEVATADRTGLMTAIRRGEAPALARYEGAYAATTVTVMGDRQEFVWRQPETWGRIDELVAAKWQRMKIEPSQLCGDAEFLRRVFLDLTGLPPTPDQVREFLADPRDVRTKRNEVIDQLIGSDDFVEYWTNKWADLLQVNRKYLGPEGAARFRQWIRAQLAANRPYDQFAREILTASGSNREQPAASYYKILRDPLDAMENSTHLFLGVRFNCNKCHDHPFERWTQDQYYETAAWFARLGLQADPASGDKKIGGSAVEGAKPLYEIVSDRAEGEVVHERTGEVAPPKFPFDCQYPQPQQEASRRSEFDAWISSPNNPYFARSYVNRLWGYLLGVGIIEPLDDIRAGNPPTNSQLLDYLTQQLVDSGFDARHVIREICRSRTYQLSIETNRWNADDAINYSHALARRLPAEVLYDTIYRAAGSVSKIPGVPPGTRAAALPDSGINAADGFLTNLGRPARESACECERSSGLQLRPVMALISGPSVDNALADPDSELAQLARSEVDAARLVDELFLRILSRHAKPEETADCLAVLQSLPAEHQKLVAQRDARERELAPRIAENERQRAQSMAAAQAKLADYEGQTAEREANLDRQQQDRIAKAQAALQQYEQELPQRLADWEQRLGTPADWSPLEVVELAASNNAQLARQDDGSILASGPNGKGQYRIVARTELRGITGFRLEALADDRLPSKGPGRAPNGNFVLSELRVDWTPEGQPDDPKPVELQNALADFSQDGYAVATAIDGRVEPASNGWASSPRLGENRTAVFETKSDLDAVDGLLAFTLDQQFQDGQHSLGRFRISVTRMPRPIRLDGLPGEVLAILAVNTAARSEQQKAQLLDFYRGVDAELKRRQQDLSEAAKPRPIDPQLQQLRDEFASASQPLAVDPLLARLRHDVQLSAGQLQNARLTFAQDLAWALINSPAFLFNR